MGTVLLLNELNDAIATLKEQGKRVVFTNGCFDLLHIGHVRYLREAKSLGDILVIGMNTDASVGRIKPGRPVTPQEQRAEMLAALDMVDYVILFNEDTPYELIKRIRPDVLVKGGDWKPTDIVGADLVPDVRSLPFIPGVSTTSVIQRIRALAG
jgi:D-beta-D-heptose 7-phosphate kinase/D-beta-D-heptose 1-phosphate adenosyltransferase